MTSTTPKRRPALVEKHTRRLWTNLLARCRQAGQAPPSRWRFLRFARAALDPVYGGKCPYCNRPLRPRDAGVDHRTPISRGGKSNLGNLSICHKTCNTRKGPLNVAEWADLLSVLAGLTAETRVYVMSKLACSPRYGA